MKVRPLGYALGAEVTGVDLKQPLDDRALQEIRTAWFAHIVLCFPGQDLEPEELSAFAGRLGELDDNRATPHLRHPEHPEIYVMVNKPIVVNERSYAGGIADSWHTDNSYTVRAASGTFLNAKELPAVGGDTMFANMYVGYETLSPAFQRTIDPLEAIHDVSLSSMFKDYDPELQAERMRLNPPVVHPVVRAHPETGRKALYVGHRVRRFVGMTEEESAPIRDFLTAHSTRYEFTYRHRWTVNDLLLWDNRCAMHRAVADYDRRELRRMIRCNLLPPKSGYVYSEPAKENAEAPVESASASLGG
jgi:taurine dioxygenase